MRGFHKKDLKGETVATILKCDPNNYLIRSILLVETKVSVSIL